MRRAMVWLLGLGLAVIGLGSFSSSANANSIFAPNPPSITPVGSNFRWDYQVVVSQGSQVLSGDGFTIYDFAGFVSVGTPLPGGWALVTNPNAPNYTAVGPPPGGENRADNDNPAVTDLILTYTGPAIGSTASDVSLGTFSFVSTFGNRGFSFFESKDHTFDGRDQTNNHNTDVPVGVPVPAAIWGGLGLLGALFTAKVTRKQ